MDSLAEPNPEDQDAHDSFKMALQAGTVCLDAMQAEIHFSSMIGSLRSVQLESSDLAEEVELFQQLATNALKYLEACKM